MKSEISSNYIFNSRTKHQVLLTELIQNTKNEKGVLTIFPLFVEQKDESFNKTDSLPPVAMSSTTEENFSELDSIADQGAFEMCEKEKVPKGKTIINMQWVFTRKFDEKGDLKRYKARCVARGFKQKQGIDYQVIFSPTGRLLTLRFLISNAVQTGHKIQQADFVTAYLNSKLEEDKTVFTELPDGFME
ncbi:hypothetical protein O181_034561 [Austropuccinia psidii MF-1]|uniref:Reverse transcriptase Ty1/copia-type domain-containing protein n=1 Tax=Austropuccinia psidii MF-1 TaxID=1389203 RepID=A0A9Q3H855_9BASI|nr:hypothetical protein [Austropuccinia psidii MF-1]